MPKRKPRLTQPVTVEEARGLVEMLRDERSSLSAQVAATGRILDLIGLAPQPRVEVTPRSEVTILRVPATRQILRDALSDGDAAPPEESGPAR